MCRVLGVIGNGDVQAEVLLGLYMQIYAGDHSTGIASFDGSTINLRKSKGKAVDVFPNLDPTLNGHIAIGHNGCGFGQIQPIIVEIGKESVAIATDSSRGTTSRIVKILKSSSDVISGVKESMFRIRRPFSLIVLSREFGIIAARNSGIKPLTVGRFAIDGLSGFYVGSQSGVLLEGEFIDSVEPGNMSIVRQDSYHNLAILPQPVRRHCANEDMFKQRPGNRSGKHEVNEIRFNIGKALGEKYVLNRGTSKENYLAIPILEGGRQISMGFSAGSGTPVDPAGSMKNIYSVTPEMKRIAEQIDLSPDFSLTPIPNIKGKRIILVDDQMLSGGKIQHMVEQCYRFGAKEVEVAVGSIAGHSCPYGDAAYLEEELIIRARTVEQICQDFGISSLTFLTPQEIVKAIDNPERLYCVDCLY
jgi:amidophosphoribosyltransferase